MAVEAGAAIRERRRQRRWTLRQLAERTGLTGATIQRLEAGAAGSLEAYARLAVALGLRPQLELVDPRRPPEPRHADAVHAWMGDVEAAWLHELGLPVAIDEPYKHFQFAGRADVLSVLPDHRALLHIENRTRFPDLQDMAGSYNAKKAYLARAVAQRLGLHRGFDTVTHVMAALWSAEVQHLVRLRAATFRALCPDDVSPVAGWLRGEPPAGGVTSTFILLDPLRRPRARQWVGLDAAVRAEPRYRGYADAAASMLGATMPGGEVPKSRWT